MYANSYGPASPPPGLSSNPFVGDPTTAHARFPDLNSSNVQTGYPSTAYLNQPQQYPQQYQPYPPQSQPHVPGPGSAYQPQPQVTSPQSQFASTSYAPQYSAQGIGAFQPTTGYAQQYPIGSGYSYASPGGGYPQAQPQPQTTTTVPPSYLSEFDPYAQSQSQGQSQVTAQAAAGSVGPNGVTHPRDLIRIHKSGLEAWDTYSWKQLLGACDSLKEAWMARKQQAEGVVRQYGGPDPRLFGPDPAFGYNSQIEGWKQVLRDANNHLDTVVASTFQLQEVFNSYRQSGDQASKRRVRESCNAAIKGLPDWPGN